MCWGVGPGREIMKGKECLLDIPHPDPVILYNLPRPCMGSLCVSQLFINWKALELCKKYRIVENCAKCAKLRKV